MSGARRVAVWHGHTQSHGFMVDVFEDEEQGLFIANIAASTPAFMSALRVPGEKAGTMSFEEPDKLQHEDRDMLKALAKARLTERYGKILVFVERAA